jgi:hypothetical protein
MELCLGVLAGLNLNLGAEGAREQATAVLDAIEDLREALRASEGRGGFEQGVSGAFGRTRGRGLRGQT